MPTFTGAEFGYPNYVVFTKISSYRKWIEQEVNETLSLDTCKSSYRQKTPVTKYFSQSVVRIVDERGENCTGQIISHQYILMATGCFGAFIPKHVIVNGTLNMTVKEVHQKAGITLVELKGNIT